MDSTSPALQNFTTTGLQILESDLHIIAAKLENIDQVPPALIDEAEALAKANFEFACKMSKYAR